MRTAFNSCHPRKLESMLGLRVSCLINWTNFRTAGKKKREKEKQRSVSHKLS